MTKPAILWFRQDLRLTDNPALTDAIENELPVIPVYIYAPEEDDGWPPGGASKWWLHQSLQALTDELEQCGSYLAIRSGESLGQLQSIIKETGADTVLFNRRYEPEARELEQHVAAKLSKAGITVRSFNSSLLREPGLVRNKEGKPFKVFTAYWRNCLLADQPQKPLPKPATIKSWPKEPDSITLKKLALEPKIKWAKGLEEAWAPGSNGVRKNLRHLTNSVIHNYADSRNRPDQNGVSRLSPHLHFGEVSPNMIWHEVRQALSTTSSAKTKDNAEIYLKEIGWREFAYDLLVNFPYSTNEPLYEDYANFPFLQDARALKAWQKGLTGYPMVDAGMRELWHTGWMHNRVRMIVGSFLVKDLLLPWQAGAKWFWDTLVDADLASNTMGWQWVAGCGADAAPYFRIFNPISQGAKFDPDGDYVRKWVPELAKVPTKYIHSPWLASKDELRQAGVELGKDYPLPIIDHAFARTRALAALKEAKSKI
jgi:deoxyribodipyrimidine photo-lyase